MGSRDKKVKTTRAFSVTAIIFIILAILPVQVSAKVTGVCSNCHTMHNSQNGAAVDGSGPNGSLLSSNCVGCHSSSSGDTIINNTPIVYNTGGYPAEPLAGGNFYWVAQGATYDGYGHNVYGISDQDTYITVLEGAPGEDSSCFYANACHFTLAEEPQLENNNKGGCQGCHYFTYHHTDHNDANGVSSRYRFLTGHDGTPTTVQRYVKGKEDANWEQTPTLANHNTYKGFDGPVGSEQLDDTNSISSFCGGCHMKFHQDSDIGSASPWLRHPTDIKLPPTGGIRPA